MSAGEGSTGGENTLRCVSCSPGPAGPVDEGRRTSENFSVVGEGRRGPDAPPRRGGLGPRRQ